MKLEIRTLIIMLCAALALTTACKKTPIPTEDPQPSVVDFRASSQATWVKTETSTTPQTQSFPYDNFGVWGIARDANIPATYNLWNNSFTEVVRKYTETNEPTDQFIPNGAEYWLRGYTYNFLAYAPYGDTGLTNLSVTHANTQGNTSGKDYVSFTYDLSSKYSVGKYTFDFLGAAAENQIRTGGYSAPQGLTFWHLFSQIEIENIGFASDIDGTVTKILFKSFPSGQYEISYDNSVDNKTSTTGVECKVITKKSDNSVADKSEIVFTNPNFNSSTSRPIINIIPQKVEYFELYIDFTINEGTSSATYQGFKLDITNQQLSEYVYNGKYNWEITIGRKNAVSFNVVQINDWKSGTTPDDIPLQ